MTARGLAADGARAAGEGERFGAAALPYELLAGFDRLARSPPLWPTSPERWETLIERVRAFAFDWHGTAVACGWSLASLYALHREQPLVRRDVMGAAFLAALSARDCAVGITGAAILVKTRTGALLRIYRPARDAAAVLAWSLCPGSR